MFNLSDVSDSSSEDEKVKGFYYKSEGTKISLCYKTHVQKVKCDPMVRCVLNVNVYLNRCLFIHKIETFFCLLYYPTILYNTSTLQL